MTMAPSRFHWNSEAAAEMYQKRVVCSGRVHSIHPAWVFKEACSRAVTVLVTVRVVTSSVVP